MKMPKGALWGKEARFMLLPYPSQRREHYEDDKENSGNIIADHTRGDYRILCIYRQQNGGFRP